jgi:hypothetical protein
MGCRLMYYIYVLVTNNSAIFFELQGSEGAHCRFD